MTRLIRASLVCWVAAGCGSSDQADNSGTSGAEASSTGANQDPTVDPTMTATPTGSTTTGPGTSSSSSNGDPESSGSADPTPSTGTADTDPGTGSTTTGGAFVPSLNQAAYNGAAYEFGFNSIPTLPITGAPDGVDWSRWAILHDGADYRLYFLPEGASDHLIQFAFNPATQEYEFGFNSIPEVPITGAPADVDPASFAMMHDGTDYRLYFLSVTAPLQVHQFAYNASVEEYVYAFNAIPEIPVTGTPAAADWTGWGMLHDGSDYRLYAFATAAHDSMVQHAFNPDVGEYQWGFNSIPEVSLELTPADSNTDNFAMVHDGADYRFYFLTMPE